MNAAPISRRFCLAPMMDQSDRHCRFIWRLITKHSLLYTEMVTSSALLHGDRERFLQYNPEEHPLALQLGGSDPIQLSECAKLAEDKGFDEVNLNCGCPSDRVQTGRIGACLMAEPQLVADCLKAMQDAVDIPVTIKHRIGIDDQDEYQDLTRFVSEVANTGCKSFIVHARKAWLKGLSPKQNREVPPLLYERVYQLKQEFPHLEIIINGGIDNVADTKTHLEKVDGVMVGRQAYTEPYFLADIDKEIFGDKTLPISREEILESYHHYCQRQLTLGVPWQLLVRPILGLFHGQPGGKRFRRFLSINRTGSKGKQADLLLDALNYRSENSETKSYRQA